MTQRDDTRIEQLSQLVEQLQTEVAQLKAQPNHSGKVEATRRSIVGAC
jgi:hypothetical protein